MEQAQDILEAFFHGLWNFLVWLVKATGVILRVLLHVVVFVFEMCLWFVGGFLLGAMAGHIISDD